MQGSGWSSRGGPKASRGQDSYGELTALRGEGQRLLKNTGAWALQPETLI